MNFPFLTNGAIDFAARRLLQRAFGARLDRGGAIDLEEVVAFLSETEELSYNDDAELGMEGDEIVLGKTQPLRRRIMLSRTLKLDPQPGRARFTLAHEIGHWVLHRPIFVAKAKELSLFGAGDDDEFEFVGLNKAIFPDGSRREVRREEWQANRFAVDLLIDTDVIRAEFLARFGMPVVARCTPEWQHRSHDRRGHARILASHSAGAHLPLRDVFGLSTEAMAIALESRGYAVEQPPVV